MANEVEARERWLDEKMREQQHKAKYDPPVVMSSAISQQREELEKLATPIMNTPKPKVEPPKEEKKEEKKESPAGASPGAAGDNVPPEQMDLD